MFALKRWWGRNATKLIGSGVALGSAAFLWQTQSALLWETYQTISLPFRPNAFRSNILNDSQVKGLQIELAEAQAQNKKYKQLLEAPNELAGQKINAPVIGRGADNWWQQIALGRGSRDGVEVGAIVLSDGGLVGRITQVTNNASQVLLVTDPTSRIGVLLSRTRQMGYIQGNSDRSDRVVLQFFDKTPDVKVGDKVVTSTVSQRFPGGLAVGEVVSIDMQKTPAPEAIIKVTAPLNALEWVRIYPAPKQSTTGALDLETR
jgi:rod shape-determining protein MreC